MTAGPALGVRPALADAELDELSGAARPGRRTDPFGPVLERSTAWITARRGFRPTTAGLLPL
ncbi:hypothetical protein ACWF95_29020 [Streptomyces vinaceus]